LVHERLIYVSQNLLSQVLSRHENELLTDWLQLQKDSLGAGRERVPESQVRSQSHDFLVALREGFAGGETADLSKPQWATMRELLGDLSRQRADQRFSTSETATFVFSFKQALFNRLREEYGSNSETLVNLMWQGTELLDKLGLYTTEVFMKSREEVIARQQQEMLEVSTPVVELWAGILALPLIGTLDSNRTQIVMQNLLEAIVAKSADLAIIDITGVPTVDTLVAQHLLKTVAAARLMGADCIISGIRPQIAQTIIHLGVDLGGVLTKATLADALQLALRRKSLAVGKA
jgi:rsbT co-antagonist protein RsbR